MYLPVTTSVHMCIRVTAGERSEYKRLQVNKSEYEWVQAITSSCEGLLVSASEYEWLEVIASDCKWLQGNMSDFRWLRVSSSKIYVSDYSELQ